MLAENTTIEPLAPTRIRQKSTGSKRHTRWSQEEDDLLIKLVSNVEHVNWSEVATQFPSKTIQQVTERWGKVVNPKLVKGSWTRQEDETIILFVQQYGVKNWTKLASILPGRIGKQCRERWRNHLDPEINRNPWTPEEDELLSQLHEQYGNQWVKISSLIPGRSDNSIKNRWNSTVKKHNVTVAVRATPTTPMMERQIKIDTPTSLSADVVFPIPNLADTPVQMVVIPNLQPVDENAINTPWMGTPLKSNFELMSPLVGRSPGAFASPFLPGGKGIGGTFWSPDGLRTPMQDAQNLFSPVLQSPIIDSAENRVALMNSLEALDKTN